jgi:hypothetical protein
MMAERLSKVYLDHGRNDLAAMSEMLLSRYSAIGEEAFVKLIESKFAMIDRLAIESAARPFVVEEIGHHRESHEKKQRIDPGVSAAKPKEDASTGDIEIRVKDHNGKSRVTKARPGTVIDNRTGNRIPGNTTLRALAVSNPAGPLDLKIVPK